MERAWSYALLPRIKSLAEAGLRQRPHEGGPAQPQDQARLGRPDRGRGHHTSGSIQVNVSARLDSDPMHRVWNWRFRRGTQALNRHRGAGPCRMTSRCEGSAWHANARCFMKGPRQPLSPWYKYQNAVMNAWQWVGACMWERGQPDSCRSLARGGASENRKPPRARHSLR